MTNPTLRIADVTTDEWNDAELLSLGQLMYRDGLLPEVTVPGLCALSGKPAGEVDTDARARRMLIEHGYQHHVIEAEPLGDRPDTYEEWMSWLARNGDPDVRKGRKTRRTYAHLRDWQAALIQLRRDAGPRWTTERRQATVADADRLLADGWTLEVLIAGNDGWALHGLVLGRRGAGYVTYDPTRGVQMSDASVLGDEDGQIRSLYAWRATR